ncbi:trans-resveratrol di-O-methyltransferase-like [Neltuma alba]|uniref:trans-resveratrol di-O-methyltransferase-like n=1 Tax=Neltuma alba TaxID=207710 RepID=UPI0010A4115A|nr:trans-resveratrol di-O-methyltransferase-like [Prosopis alba]XP_028797432.1 trans-resveratrol di-O-methyltransferase-like [Prosopis alba]
MDINKGNVEAETQLFQAQAHVYKHVFNFLGSMSLKSALQLNIPDIIHSHGRPITLPKLLLALHIDPAKSSHLYRLMRLLVHSGFFSTVKVPKGDEEEVGYDLTPSSRLLLKDNVPSLFYLAQAMLHPAIVHSSEHLGDWFSSNEPTPFYTVYGMGCWDYVSQNKDFSGLFNEALISDSSMMNLVIKDCRSVFEGFNSLVDVGGGKGAASRVISESLPNLQCTVLDFPYVVENLQDSENLKFVGGDMFQSIPAGDAILLKLVLHGYGDEDCVKVLKKCKEAIASKGREGKVIIIDKVINEQKDERDVRDAKLFFDVMMMIMTNGREREEKEWEKLFLEAGFSHYKITSISGLRSLIEVYP